MRLTVICGFREFFYPFVIPEAELRRGLRLFDDPTPPQIIRVPWHSPEPGSTYHEPLVDQPDALALTLEYLGDVYGPNDAPWLFAPEVSALDASVSSIVDSLRETMEIREACVAWTRQGQATLMELSKNETSAERLQEVLSFAEVVPDSLRDALARNFSFHAARLAAERLLSPDFPDPAEAATKIAHKLDEFSLRFAPDQDSKKILEVVERRLEGLIGPS